MSKWALFAAHRYVRWGSGARTVGPDGRKLLRPWRVRSDAAEQEAKRRRAARAQPRWPRPLGFLLIVVAVLAVNESDWPIPTHVQASSAERPAGLSPLIAESPIGPVEGVPVVFLWAPADVPPPFRLVVLDASYDEIARIEDIGGTTLRPPVELAQRLASGGDFHWYVEATITPEPVRSLLKTVEIR
jgi:hypothetical protein